MSQLMSLAAAVAAHVRDGDTLAMEGFTHLIPHAAGHEVIRQQRRRLTLIRMTPDLIYDQLIGMTVTSIHPGATREQIDGNTGWKVKYAAEVGETAAPSAEELAVLRELHARTKRAHGDQV